ncbi:unnamed protein product, partial [Polarella glacialis]
VAIAASEQRRAAEVAALEWKLHETRQRHQEELAYLGGSGRSVQSDLEAWSRGSVDTGEVLGHSRSSSWVEAGPGYAWGTLGQGAGHLPSGNKGHETNGPVLASRRRDIGDAAGRRCVRLWVEDVPCPSASSAPSFSG